MPLSFRNRLDTIPSTRQTLASGGFLFDRGDTVTHLFAVLSGQIRLLRRHENGTEALLQRAGPTAILAEASLLSETYHCAAEANGPTDLQVWRKGDVTKALAASTETARAYTKHLAREVQAARMRAEIGALRRLTDRLDAWLVWHDNRLPEKGSWRHLAEDINVSPEALYRELSKRRRG